MVAATTLIILVSGCTRIQYVYPELPLPEPPLLPAVSSDETACLSDEAYEKIVIRETRRKNYAEVLRAIIAEHNVKAGEQ